MAFNLRAFRTRTLTAAVFVIVMLTGLLLSHWSFLILFSVIHTGCWIEYQRLIGMIDADYKTITPFHRYGVIIAGLGFMLWMTSGIYHIGNINLNETGLWLMYVLLIAVPVVEIVLSKQFNLKLLSYSLLGLIYISLSMGLMIALRTEGFIFENTPFSIDFGWIIPIILIATLWINDTMAYIIGSLIGHTPFSKVSPNKTWEGTLGGALLSVSIVTLISHAVFQSDYLPVFLIALITVVMGTAGDLLESKLKRLAGAKDSGNIMPGHGGFLDRFDSLLIATPFVWLFVKLFV
ncbi:MAG: phosphatidate cytidylyltransferase [Parafilimonas sp.]